MKTIALGLAGLVLAGCNGGEEPGPPAEDGQSLSGAATGAIDKAKALEDQAMQHKEAIDVALEEAGGTAAEPSDDEQQPE